ncbi:T9SS type B sorting domain-containing protein [Flammeovirga pectinis]|uniref:T9SS type B sorting domain-containing protein n=1 Tax=Flammeovirga pectinis TaxID=2494373 RepID=A0A3S9PAU9_9BACT|nr:gliding motility-associated C-terminal domain-containing protein [Flammeovirga pectinis]AZQ65297.1 T9SS type B sorting domain-containing protein [Flammeovirga pectinis]
MKKSKYIIVLLGTIFLMGFVVPAFVYTYQTLGTWSTSGRPNYILSQKIISLVERNGVSGAITDSINTKGERFLEDNNVNILVVEEGEVFITLVYEDAGWFNTLGFYTYQYTDIPNSPSDVSDPVIIFPNLDSPNVVDSGMKISLGTYPAGTVIGFFLVAKGWSNGIIDGDYTLYSNSNFNEGITQNSRYSQLTVIFENDDTDTHDFVLAIEDNVNTQDGDYDYNDAVFFLDADPELSIIQFDGLNNDPIVARDSLIFVHPNYLTDFNLRQLVTDDNIDLATITIDTVITAQSSIQVESSLLRIETQPNDSEYDTIRYTACDNEFPRTCDNGVLIVGKLPPNDPPVAIPVQNLEITSNITNNGIEISQLGSDPNDNLENGEITITNFPKSALNARIEDGKLRINPPNTYSGIDTINFRICDEGFPILCDEGQLVVQSIESNTPPIANPETIYTYTGETVLVDILRNDRAFEESIDLNAITIISAPSLDTCEVRIRNGKLEHTASDYVLGDYSLVYQICDESEPALCDTTSVYFHISDSIDPDTIVSQNNPPTAVFNRVRTSFNVPINIDILNNDYDLDGNLDVGSTYIITQGSDGNGVLDFFIEQGDSVAVMTYTPNENFSGIDILSYKIFDDGYPQLSDNALVIIEVEGEEKEVVYNNDNILLDSTVIDVDETFCLNIPELLASKGIQWVNFDTDIIVDPSIFGSEAYIDSLDLCYTATSSITESNRDYVHYKVCNNGTCINGLLIITIDEPIIITPPDIIFFNAFSPNKDGFNDLFIIENLRSYPDNSVTVYNRWGQKVFSDAPYNNDWEGTNIDGQPLPDGTYYYIASVNNGNDFSYNGYLIIKR